MLANPDDFIIISCGYRYESDKIMKQNEKEWSSIPDIINMTEPLDFSQQSAESKKKQKKYKEKEYERYVSDKEADRGCNNFLCSEDKCGIEMAKLFDRICRVVVPICYYVEKCFGAPQFEK